MSTTNSPSEEGTPAPNPIPQARKPRRLRIGEREVVAMCECLAQRMTERESCQVLGIEERTWYRWKNHARNSERLRKYLDRITGQKIATHLGNIEAGAIGAGPHKRADWRASQAILGIIDRNRFSPTAPPPPVQTAAPTPPATVNVWIDLAYAQVAEQKPGEVVDVQSSKQLVESTESPAAFPETQPSSPAEVWMKPSSADLAPPAPPPPARTRRMPPMIADKTPDSAKGD
jgi:hypothetical protein